MGATESEEGMRTYMPYIKTRRGVFNNLRPLDSIEAALAKYEEWTRDYHITSAWIDERSDEPPYFRRHKVKLIGVLKKGETI